MVGWLGTWAGARVWLREGGVLPPGPAAAAGGGGLSVAGGRGGAWRGVALQRRLQVVLLERLLIHKLMGLGGERG